jgi:pimeloyl-ACP methyl ester carboxylesterase
MNQRLATEQQWQVNGLQLAGLSWGEPGDKPLLALHGWMDNAASFSLLAPLLEGYHVVALDLTGHGQSGRRSADAAYQIWDDLPEVEGVLEALGWDHFSLIGHSRGAIISSLFCGAFPERVRRLVLMDALVPQAIEEQAFPAQMRKYLLDKKRLLGRDTRVFASLQDAVNVRLEGGLDEGAARLLAQRNLMSCEGGYTWTTDPRLHGASAAKLTEGQCRAVLQALSMPVLLLLAEDGHGQRAEIFDLARDCIDDLALEQVSGGHHFHMEPDVTEVALRIKDFLDG